MKSAEDIRHEVEAFESNPRAEILAMLLEAAAAAREELSAYKRAKALALIASTLRKLLRDGPACSTTAPLPLAHPARAKA